MNSRFFAITYRIPDSVLLNFLAISHTDILCMLYKSQIYCTCLSVYFLFEFFGILKIKPLTKTTIIVLIRIRVNVVNGTYQV